MCDRHPDPAPRVRRFGELGSLIRAADGLSLAQVCAMTGTEPSTVQNWIKRGFVPHPERKRYRERHVARILLIDALRDALLIERVGELMRSINGNVDDTADDVITEEALYDLFMSAAEEIGARCAAPQQVEEQVERIVCQALEDPAARARVAPALSVMVSAGIAAAYKREADRLYLAKIQPKPTAEPDPEIG